MKEVDSDSPSSGAEEKITKNSKDLLCMGMREGYRNSFTAGPQLQSFSPQQKELVVAEQVNDAWTSRDSSSSSPSRTLSDEAARQRRFATSPSLWRRIQWGIALSLGGRESFSHLQPNEAKCAVAAGLELAIMGSTLALALTLQIQEVVGSRGGFEKSNGTPTGRHVFVLSTALSFGFAFYAIVTSSIMLLAFSACPPSRVNELFQKFSGWLYTSRVCTLSAAISLGVSACTGHFLALERSTAFLGASIIALVLVGTIGALAAIISVWHQFHSQLPQIPTERNTHESAETRLNVGENNGGSAKPVDITDIAGLETSPCRTNQHQPPLSTLSSVSTAVGISVRSSRLAL